MKQKSIRKKEKKITIKRIKIKFDIKIKWNQMIRDEIEKEKN
jgi:hypothetical protein